MAKGIILGQEQEFIDKRYDDIHEFWLNSNNTTVAIPLEKSGTYYVETKGYRYKKQCVPFCMSIERGSSFDTTFSAITLGTGTSYEPRNIFRIRYQTSDETATFNFISNFDLVYIKLYHLSSF